MTTGKKITTIVNSLKKNKPQAIYLFGSVAKKRNHQQSDLDLLVVKDSSLSFEQRVAEEYKNIWQIQKKVGPVDLLVYTPEEFNSLQKQKHPFILDVLNTGQKIYG